VRTHVRKQSAVELTAALGVDRAELRRRDHDKIRNRLDLGALDLQPVHARILRRELDSRRTIARRDFQL
jgi:hypothetical protein